MVYCFYFLKTKKVQFIFNLLKVMFTLKLRLDVFAVRWIVECFRVVVILYSNKKQPRNGRVNPIRSIGMFNFTPSEHEVDEQ